MQDNKKKKHRFKSIDGAVRAVRRRDRLLHQYRSLANELSLERKLMARLADDTPQFSNPVEIWEAKKLRDKILLKRS
jgi:hypothetical protein